MLRRIAAVLLVVLTLSLQGCVSAGAGLQSYADSYDGYEFLYPTGWVPVNVPENGPDVVFRDIINDSENVSVVISDVPKGKTLQELGSPSEVGYKLAKSISATAEDDRNIDLISAETREVGPETYYVLEYAVQLPTGQARHNLASVIVRRGQLFTFNASTLESRWSKVSDLLHQAVESFSVY